MALFDKSVRQLQELASSFGITPSRETEFLGEEVDLAEEEPDLDIAVAEYDDGTAVVDFGDGVSIGTELPGGHGENIAVAMEEDELRNIASELIRSVEDDLASRKDWEQTLNKSLEELGFKIQQKNTPWPGACSVVHPLLSESIVRFQSETIGAIFPATGPVRGSVLGTQSPEKIAQAQRVERHMNYVLLEEMDEYRPETERLLFGLALNGAAFRKVFPNPLTGKPKSVYIDALNLIVNHDATDMLTADRITHRMKMSRYEVERLIDVGFYRDTLLTEPMATERDFEKALDDLTGMNPIDTEPRFREIFEIQCYWDLGETDGFMAPYIITVDKTDNTVLSIYRNWAEDSPTRERIHHIVHYEFIPGLGFYGFGYAHLVGNTAKAATSILQQLVDAGTLANVPGGLKTRNARMENDSGPILPGEWRDVDVPGQKIADHFMPLPTKEPSATLFQLMQSMVEDGRRLASMADLKLADMNQQAPVGTTLAILERSMKMQTAIQQRIHAGLKSEFRILARVIKDSGPSYPYEVEEGEGIAEADYDDRIDVIPVSDPNASSLSQRVMQYQAALTAAQQAPDVFDRQMLNRQFIEAIGLQNADKIVPMNEDIDGKDPVSENADILNLGKVAAKIHQDHQAHIQVHMALQQDPQIQQMAQNSPTGGQILAALDAHIREHMAFQMRREIEDAMGVPLPEPGKKLPEDVENRIARMAADAAAQVTGKKAAEAQAAQNAQMQQDPIIQMKQQELQIRQMAEQTKAMKAQSDAQLAREKMAAEQQAKQMELMMRAKEAADRNDLETAKLILGQMKDMAEMEQSEVMQGVETGLRAAELASRGNGAQ